MRKESQCLWDAIHSRPNWIETEMQIVLYLINIIWIEGNVIIIIIIINREKNKDKTINDHTHTRFVPTPYMFDCGKSGTLCLGTSLLFHIMIYMLPMSQAMRLESILKIYIFFVNRQSNDQDTK